MLQLHDNSEQQLVIVCGPESSGTRVFYKLLGQCAGAVTISDINPHLDLFDVTWEAIRKDAHGYIPLPAAAYGEAHTVMTRRSLPSGPNVQFGEFDDIWRFICEVNARTRRRVKLVIPVRSPMPHLVSWATARSSIRKQAAIDPDKKASRFNLAYQQYQLAYRYLASVLCASDDFDFLFVTLEELSTPNAFLYLDSIAHILNMTPPDKWDHTPKNVNHKRYEYHDRLVRKNSKEIRKNGR